MKIANRIKTSTITSINASIPAKSAVPHEKLAYTSCVIPATIDEKIIKETQLDIHFSVINSPNRINSIDPTVIDNEAIIMFTALVSITFPPSI